MCRHIDRFDCFLAGYYVGLRNLEGRMLVEFILEKELCVQNTWFQGEEKRKVTCKLGENGTKIDTVLRNEHWEFLQTEKAIHGEFPHALVVADNYKRKIRKVV